MTAGTGHSKGLKTKPRARERNEVGKDRNRVGIMDMWTKTALKKAHGVAAWPIPNARLDVGCSGSLIHWLQVL